MNVLLKYYNDDPIYVSLIQVYRVCQFCLVFKILQNEEHVRKSEYRYTPQPLYNTIVGVHSINRVN